MGEPFKNLIGRALVADAAEHLRRTWRRFPAADFVADAGTGLDALEMKARVLHIATALERALPDDFDRAAGIVERALAPPHVDEDLGAMRTGPQGLAGWIVWPLGEWVVRRGMSTPERGLQALRELTQRFSAEFAVRPFIVAHPSIVFDHFGRWAADPNLHVRRWVSEGSRPRLPWGLRLHALVADPSPTLPLLRTLQDDASGYVRRSVANHLNDIAKDHPALVADWLAEHLPGAPAERRQLLAHASRTLVKRGDAAVLKAWGYARGFRGDATLALTPARLRIGQSVALRATLRSTSRRSQRLVVDYAVHHVKAAGHATAKVFKGWTLDLAAGASVQLDRSHSMREVTTRRYHPGLHRVELLVNGETAAAASFDLRPAA
ncbi:MAG: DNA alkylation repair protein [Rubrivivax sp.]|jgi:3-methyladenine DNA glycosylase AlkC|nr:DNA alkylation repair protein [Rubrivivax sp.]